MNTPDEQRPPGGEGDGRRARRPLRATTRVLRNTSALPAMFTILNALAGFASIHYATKDQLGHSSLLHLTLAAWLIVLAMVFDMLDGRVARLTRKTSDFGAQLDSLCDIISFGVAPAVLMLRTTILLLRDNIAGIYFLPEAVMPNFPIIERVVWSIAAAYVACAALRLARFNVENLPDESSHMAFKGLPSPGAAALITVLVLLLTSLARPLAPAGDDTVEQVARVAGPWLLTVVGLILPALTLAVALLMVSNVRYVHLLNHFIRGHRPFSYIVKLTIVLVAAVINLYVTGAVLVTAYVLSGPILALVGRIRRRPGARGDAPQS